MGIDTLGTRTSEWTAKLGSPKILRAQPTACARYQAMTGRHPASTSQESVSRRRLRPVKNFSGHSHGSICGLKLTEPVSPLGTIASLPFSAWSTTALDSLTIVSKPEENGGDYSGFKRFFQPIQDFAGWNVLLRKWIQRILDKLSHLGSRIPFLWHTFQLICSSTFDWCRWL